MEAFASYLIKSVIWLAGFAVIYILFLRNERFFSLNRGYLLAGILSSFFFPLISIHYTVVLPVVVSIQTDSAVVSEIKNAGNSIIPLLKLMLLVLYLSGVFVVLYLIIRQSRSIVRAIRKSEITTLYPVKLIRTPEYTSAFSFFSYVFVNPSVTDIEAREIMNHELVHIRQKHWLDLVLVELLCIMQWFNPIVWIYIRFIRQNHEYLADEVALQRTSDPAIYRAVLLNQIVGSPVVNLANSFNYSPNTKRFKMMKNIISSPYRKMKILLILPVFAIVLYAFAKPDYKYKTVDKNSGILSTATSLIQNEVKGTVVQKDGNPLPGANITLMGTTTGTVTDASGSFKLVNVPDDGAVVVSFVGFKSKVIKPDFKSQMRIEMVKDTIKYSDLNISTPPPPPPPPPPPLSGLKVKGEGSPLYVVDGIKVTEAEAEKIDPNSIESINVLKNKSVMDKYGEKGRDGVIEITTRKKAMEDFNKTPKIYNNPDSLGKLLVIIDGVVHEKDGMSDIPPEDIKAMSVLTGKSAIEKYGERGKNGAIELTLFKSNDEKPNDKVIYISSDVKKADKEPFVVVESVSKPGSDAFVVVEELPEFPGGKDAMVVWINSNIKYPGDAVKGKITGKVYISFVISSSGKVKDVAVSKSVSPLLDEEAKRVISSMPDWKPGSQAGKRVEVQMQVPVEFKLN
jgi:TonB family protein